MNIKVGKICRALITGGFWFWNGALMIAMAFGFLPIIAQGIFLDAAGGTTPYDFLFFTTVLILLAPLSMLYAGINKFCWRRIAKFFYGVEAPIFFLCIARLFLLRELTGATAHLAVVIVIALVTFGLSLRKPGSRWFSEKIRSHCHYIGVGVGCFVAVYFGALLSFYGPATLYYMGYGLVEVLSNLSEILRSGEFFLILLYFFVYGGFVVLTGLAAFAVFPLFLVYYYSKAFVNAIKSTASPVYRGLAGAAIVINMICFLVFSTQPQTTVLAYAEKELSHEEVAWIIEHEDEVKEGIMNAYLAPYRYLGVSHGRGHIEEMYREIFSSESGIPSSLQSAYNWLASPFLYNGDSMAGDQQAAEKFYQRVFDQQIQKGEMDAVNHAIKANHNRDQVEANLLDAQSEDVLLVKQSVKVEEKGGYAEVELYEVYENQTQQDKEILYYFSLPDSAALTGVWLGQDGDEEKFFAYQVAPRGAAQQVYRNEVSRRVDPALLEQVGPESYRLRVFPVERRQLARKHRKTHLWVSYLTLPNPDGGWHSPQLLEKRNVFRNHKTKLFLNDVQVDFESDGPWFPELKRVEEGFAGLSASVSEGIYLSVRKYQAALVKNARVAVVVDTSGSMREHREQLHDALGAGKMILGKQGARVSYFAYGRQEIVGQESLPEDLVLFGNMSRVELLTKFAEDTKGENYDAVIVLSNSLDEPDLSWQANGLSLPGATWLMFVDGQLPTFFDDDLMRAVVVSGGGTETNNEQVWDRALAADTLALTKDHEVDVVGYNDGYLWTISDEIPNAEQIHGADEFRRLAGARFINYKSQLMDLDQLENLRSLHLLATGSGVVSPWSSMIVLVNDRQRQALAAAIQKSDAFDRENETGKQLLSSPPNEFGAVPGTPEPEEWALIIAALAFLLYEWRRRGGGLLVIRRLPY